jgi:hypothetical protein
MASLPQMTVHTADDVRRAVGAEAIPLPTTRPIALVGLKELFGSCRYTCTGRQKLGCCTEVEVTRVDCQSPRQGRLAPARCQPECRIKRGNLSRPHRPDGISQESSIFRVWRAALLKDCDQSFQPEHSLNCWIVCHDLTRFIHLIRSRWHPFSSAREEPAPRF